MAGEGGMEGGREENEEEEEEAKPSGPEREKTFPRVARRIVARQLDWLAPSASQKTEDSFV